MMRCRSCLPGEQLLRQAAAASCARRRLMLHIASRCTVQPAHAPGMLLAPVRCALTFHGLPARPCFAPEMG